MMAAAEQLLHQLGRVVGAHSPEHFFGMPRSLQLGERPGGDLERQLRHRPRARGPVERREHLGEVRGTQVGSAPEERRQILLPGQPGQLHQRQDGLAHRPGFASRLARSRPPGRSPSRGNTAPAEMTSFMPSSIEMSRGRVRLRGMIRR